MSGLKTKGKVLTLTVGLPASGKSSWVLKADFDIAISLDDCREQLWGSREVQDGAGGIDSLLKLQDEIITNAMADGQSIVVHNTHPIKLYRFPLFELGRKFGYRVQIVYFDVSSDECRKRNRKRLDAVPENVMDDYIQKMEIPTKDEADLVIKLTEMDFI